MATSFACAERAARFAGGLEGGEGEESSDPDHVVGRICLGCGGTERERRPERVGGRRCSGGDVLRGEDPAAPVGEEALSSGSSFWCSSGEHHLNPRLRMVRPRELQLGGAEGVEIVQSPQTPRGATQLVE